MTTETFPSGVSPNQVEFVQEFNDEEFRTANGGLFVKGRNGNRWSLVLTFRNKHSAERRELWGIIAELRGKQNRLRVGMANIGYTRAGAGGGTPTLNGAHTAGDTTLSVSGAGTVTNWLRRSDFIQVGQELKMVTQAVNSSGGSATIPIWPELHQGYSGGTSVDITTPEGDFFLVDSQGISAVPYPADVGKWLSPNVVIRLEEDVLA